MAWDLAIDAETGDWVFNPARDILAVTGNALTRQRAVTRIRIPRGTFQYDRSKQLGSRLYLVSKYPSARALTEAPALIREAFSGVTDIAVGKIEVKTSKDNSGRLEAIVEIMPVIDQVAQQNQVTEIKVGIDVSASVV